MAIAISRDDIATADANAIVVGIEPGRGSSIRVQAGRLAPALQKRLTQALETLGATGSSGELTRVPGISGIATPVIVGVGLGDARAQQDREGMRRAIGNAIRSLTGHRHVALSVPVGDDAALRDIATAAGLAAYSFTAFKSKAADAASLPVRQVTILVPGEPGPTWRSIIKEANTLVAGVTLARNLVNTPPNALSPARMAKEAKAAMAGLPVTVSTWDEAALRRDGCGGILGVGQGSVNPPRMVRLAYRPAGAKAHLALVGKGITFDTGGISIKPAENMDHMKADMSGAAAVIAAMQVIATIGLRVRVTGWVPMAENMPGGGAMRPGDVITMFDGTTVEVLNTDAEGRLILADALGMAVADRPTLILDAATLTGAQRIALGARTAGAMSNDDEARGFVCRAADEAGEAVWPMPLPEDLRASLDSMTADIANIGDRLGGMLTAGVFLSTFVPSGQPWVHLDIAGPAFNEKAAYGYTPKGGTGAAVRTFVQVARLLAAG